jgi:hypothetical protein
MGQARTVGSRILEAGQRHRQLKLVEEAKRDPVSVCARRDRGPFS